MQNSQENTCTRAFLFFSLGQFLKTNQKKSSRSAVRKLFLQILRNLQENACARDSFLLKFAGLRPKTLLKRRRWQRCFPVSFAKFLRTPFFTERLQWLLLKKETPAEMFYCEFSKNFNKTYFVEQLRVTTSLLSKMI